MNGDKYIFILDFEDGKVYKYLYPEVLENDEGKIVENNDGRILSCFIRT